MEIVWTTACFAVNDAILRSKDMKGIEAQVVEHAVLPYALMDYYNPGEAPVTPEPKL
jgi:hypothetical protein